MPLIRKTDEVTGKGAGEKNEDNTVRNLLCKYTTCCMHNYRVNLQGGGGRPITLKEGKSG